MKFYLLVLIINCALFSQQNEVVKKINNLYNKVNLYYTEYKTSGIVNMNESETNDIVNLLYELYSFHWTEVHNFISEESRKIENDFRTSDDKNVTTRPAVKLKIIKDEIDKRMGKNFSEIITTPYYLKVKILEIDPNSTYISKGGMSFGKITILCQIIDVIKGKHLFKIGDHIEVSYLKGWDITPYEKDKVYFLPVKPWNCKNGNCSEYSPKLFPINYNGVSIEGCPCGIYPIEENRVKNAEFFQIFNSNWDLFLNEFAMKYVLENGK